MKILQFVCLKLIVRSMKRFKSQRLDNNVTGSATVSDKVNKLK